MVNEILPGFHILTAVSALCFGGGVFFTRKGTRLHKQFGYAYFFNMVGLNVSALLIYRLTGQFGPFHGAALASLFTLLIGFFTAYLRLPQRRWLELHYEFMSWSYVGLVAAGISEATTRIPSAPFWPAVFAGSAIIFLIGGQFIAWGRRKYNFERLAKVTGPTRPWSVSELLRRRRAACN